MPFTQQTVTELRDESIALERDLADLTAQSEIIKAKSDIIRNRLTAIKVLLSDGDEPQSETPQMKIFVSHASEGSLPDVSLKDAIRHIFVEAKGPLKSAEVRERLRSHGVETRGKTDLSARVSTELYKLKKANEVKHENGLYHYITSHHGSRAEKAP